MVFPRCHFSTEGFPLTYQYPLAEKHECGILNCLKYSALALSLTHKLQRMSQVLKSNLQGRLHRRTILAQASVVIGTVAQVSLEIL